MLYRTSPYSRNEETAGFASSLYRLYPLVSTQAMKPLLLFTLCAVFAGCNLLDMFGDDAGSWRIQPGAIVFYGDSSSVELPDTVRAGESFEVSATTFGSGCTRAAGMRVDVQGVGAVLTPMDSVYTPGPHEACTMELRELSHRAAITISSVGEAGIVIRGITRGPGTAAEGEDVTIRGSVTVVR